MTPHHRPGSETGARPARRAEGPPRLVLRFALYSAIGFALAAVAVLILVRHFATDQAERTAALHARFVASSALADRVEVTDFTAPISDQRRAELDDLFTRLVLNNGSTLLELVARRHHRLLQPPGTGRRPHRAG